MLVTYAPALAAMLTINELQSRAAMQTLTALALMLTTIAAIADWKL